MTQQRKIRGQVQAIAGRLNYHLNLKRRVLLLAVIVSTISGCGVSWWYGQIDYLLWFRVDSYFDLTGEQEDFIVKRLEKHLVWHRFEGLPEHVSFLVDTRDKLSDGVTRPEIFWFFQAYRSQLRLIVERLSGDSIEFLTTLNSEQIDHFIDELKDENEEYEERLSMSREERLQKRVEKTIESLEDWLGSLSDTQEAEVRRISLNLPDTLKPWYQKRLMRQRSFVKALRAKNSRLEIREVYFRMMLPTERKSDDRTLDPIVEMILSVDRMATPTQRQHLIDKLQKWIDDLTDIHQKPADA
jgi:uncharacterized protein DUF6279